MQKIKREDEVIVIAGKDKGKRGKVLKVLLIKRLLISGVNIIKRHTKPNPMAGSQGGIVEKEAPIHVSTWQSSTPRLAKPIVSVSRSKTVRGSYFQVDAKSRRRLRI